MNNIITKNQITIKQSALYFLDEPIERCVEWLVSNYAKDNNDMYTYDEIRQIDQNTDYTFRKRGRGGSYTITVKTEIEKNVLREIISTQLGFVEMLNDGHGEERASKSMELYLKEKAKECDALEIN